MTQYIIHLSLPFKPVDKPVQRPCSIEITRYSDDPGWREGEMLTVRDVEWGWLGDTQTFSFEAMVLSRKNFISPQQTEPQVIFEIEMADKEQIPQMIEVLNIMNPGRLENYPLSEAN